MIYISQFWFSEEDKYAKKERKFFLCKKGMV